ncbi:MAG: Smr/MutS family protein [Gammaproteobacteria bacterium]|nr:Smr/MutS family protein [Gammaproteobacteria bacterium]
MTTKNKKLSDEDAKLFRDAMEHTRPLEQDKVSFRKKPPGPMRRQHLHDEHHVMDDMLSDEFYISDVETGEEIMFVRSGLQHNVLRRLKRGHYPAEKELDLHGQTTNTARIALTEFLHHCLERKLRCVRIVHGKGFRSKSQKPVLKNKVNNWLRQRDEVLAFCSARPVDGGTGAVYVLLKTR